MTFCLKNPNYFPYSLLLYLKRIVINLGLFNWLSLFFLRNHVHQKFRIFLSLWVKDTVNGVQLHYILQ